MTPRIYLIALLFLVPAIAWPGHARADGDMELAKELFQQGERDFALGRFLDAAHAFEDAYREVPRPELLWNVAKAYRKQFALDHDINHLRRARVLFQNYAELSTGAKERAEAARERAVLDEEIHRAEEAERAARAVPLVTAPAPSPPPAPVQRAWYRRWYVWAAVAGGAAVGLGVGLGVGLTRADSNRAALTDPFFR